MNYVYIYMYIRAQNCENHKIRDDVGMKLKSLVLSFCLPVPTKNHEHKCTLMYIHTLFIHTYVRTYMHDMTIYRLPRGVQAAHSVYIQLYMLEENQNKQIFSPVNVCMYVRT